MPSIRNVLWCCVRTHKGGWAGFRLIHGWYSHICYCSARSTKGNYFKRKAKDKALLVSLRWAVLVFLLPPQSSLLFPQSSAQRPSLFEAIIDPWVCNELLLSGFPQLFIWSASIAFIFFFVVNNCSLYKASWRQRVACHCYLPLCPAQNSAEQGIT